MTMRGALAIAILLATAGPAQHSWCDEAGTAQGWVRVDEGKTGGGYSKLSNGTLLAFDFKTKALSTITPANSALSKTHNAREMVYVEHADWVLLGELYPHGERKEGAGRKDSNRRPGLTALGRSGMNKDSGGRVSLPLGVPSETARVSPQNEESIRVL
jgi:hypothetical protein